jgi:murein DD-endopeptidase MepM/ murein hydrolase activator NlpD
MAVSFNQLLKSIQAHALVNPKIDLKDYIHIDLSTKNSALKDVNNFSTKDLENYIENYKKSNNAKVAYGGYLEQRDMYKRSEYFNHSNPEDRRNIHIGLDLWIEADAPIYAPLEGEIDSFKNNRNYGDYGPTIILKHNINGVHFYTLYGHLSLQSLEDIKIGDQIKLGQKIATLGSMQVNGDYPPHLHFQIIKDIKENSGDYPGVVNRSGLEFYRSNCPDPNLLLKLE